jgi:hypothetical protein
MAAETATVSPATGIRFPVASRPQIRFANTQTISNLTANSFAPIPLPATGHVRKVSLLFTCTVTSASAGAIVAGDGPWNLISSITLTDATGQPVFQPISGMNLYLWNKYFGTGTVKTGIPRAWMNPQYGPEYAFASTATTGTATFRLDLDFELDPDTGYGCIPNLDSNASLQLNIALNATTVAFSGTTMSASSMTVLVSQHYWAPVGPMTGGVVNQTSPIGFGDYREVRYENQVATASAENTIAVNNRGGLVQGIIAVSRVPAGARVAWTAGSNVGVVYDNNAINEGVRLEEWQDMTRRIYGYLGADVATYAPIGAGHMVGLDTGVLVFPFSDLSSGRDSYLNTRVGTLLQLKATPGATATQLELITGLVQVKDAAAFYYGGN